MRMLLALALACLSSSAFAAATCAPVSTQAKILSSADSSDIHPDWSDGSHVGLSWSLDLMGDEEGSDGEFYLWGDLIDPRGNVVNPGVYVSVMEWECCGESDNRRRRH
jgi:hypothetical protein